MLEVLNKWIDEIPPIQQPQRFGNQAFRTWYEKLKNVNTLNLKHFQNIHCVSIFQESITLIQQILPENLHRAIPEIMVYLVEGFGNSTRIDYGTGHELSFIMFLCSLFKIGFLKTRDQPAVACKIFVK